MLIFNTSDDSHKPFDYQYYLYCDGFLSLSSLIALTYEKLIVDFPTQEFCPGNNSGFNSRRNRDAGYGRQSGKRFGNSGALAIIRFRTVFKDPRDIIFMFAAVAAGVSCGVFGYGIAIVGTLGFCGAAIVLYFSPFGQKRHFDGMLRFNLENVEGNQIHLEKIMKTHCKNSL